MKKLWRSFINDPVYDSIKIYFISNALEAELDASRCSQNPTFQELFVNKVSPMGRRGGERKRKKRPVQRSFNPRVPTWSHDFADPETVTTISRLSPGLNRLTVVRDKPCPNHFIYREKRPASYHQASLTFFFFFFVISIHLFGHFISIFLFNNLL